MPVGWGTFQHVGGATGRCSVHWRLDLFDVESTRTLLLNESGGLTFPGARRIAAVAYLRHKATGRRIKVTSAHFVPHADDGHGGITTFPRGRLAVTPAIHALIADAEAEVDPGRIQVIGGDFNIDLDADLTHADATDMLEQFNAAGFVSDVQTLGDTPDTHGADEYDWLLVRGGQWTAHETRVKRTSDHRAKTATLTT